MKNLIFSNDELLIDSNIRWPQRRMLLKTDETNSKLMIYTHYWQCIFIIGYSLQNFLFHEIFLFFYSHNDLFLLVNLFFDFYIFFVLDMKIKFLFYHAVISKKIFESVVLLFFVTIIILAAILLPQVWWWFIFDFLQTNFILAAVLLLHFLIFHF